MMMTYANNWQGQSRPSNIFWNDGHETPITKPCYNTRNQELLVASKVECHEKFFNRAAALLRTDVAGDQIADVKVTCDATWQKHGHQSLFGVVVVTSWETGMILDVEALSKHCHALLQEGAP